MCEITASDARATSLSHDFIDYVPRCVLHLTDIHIGAEYDAPRYCAKLLGMILRIHPQILNTGAGESRHLLRLSEVDLIKALRRLPAVYAMSCEESLWIPPLERVTDREDWGIFVFEGSDPSEEEPQEWLQNVLRSVSSNKPLILISRVPFAHGTDFTQRCAPVVVLHGDVHFQNDQSIWNLQFQCYGVVGGIDSREVTNRAFGLLRSAADYSLLQIWPDGRSECSYRSVFL